MKKLVNAVAVFALFFVVAINMVACKKKTETTQTSEATVGEQTTTTEATATPETAGETGETTEETTGQ